jgi:hypothetical protein
MNEQQGTQVTTEELLQYIGQLYVQTQILQRLLATQSQQLVESNGKVETLDRIQS